MCLPLPSIDAGAASGRLSKWNLHVDTDCITRHNLLMCCIIRLYKNCAGLVPDLPPIHVREGRATPNYTPTAPSAQCAYLNGLSGSLNPLYLPSVDSGCVNALNWLLWLQPRCVHSILIPTSNTTKACHCIASHSTLYTVRVSARSRQIHYLDRTVEATMASTFTVPC